MKAETAFCSNLSAKLKKEGTPMSHLIVRGYAASEPGRLLEPINYASPNLGWEAGTTGGGRNPAPELEAFKKEIMFL